MSVRSIRIDEDIENAIKYLSKKEKIEQSQSLRKLTRLGFEFYIAKLYEDGELTLREASDHLGLSLWETVDLLQNIGVKGNLRADDVLTSLRFLKL